MADRILTLDIGSSKALLAEFSVKGGKPVLLRFASGPLPVEGDDVGSSERLADVVRTLIRENGIKPAPMYVALPGQSVFARFFKLPPLGKDQVGETVRAEAEQSVPFPIDEVVWDYQVLGSNDGVELDAVLVAVKQDNVIGMTSAVTSLGIEPTIVDAAPVALYNAAHHCLGANAEGCTMVLDIGHRSTGLVFLEGDRVFTRNIAVAGLAITQEIQKTFNCTYREAETLKLQSGFVALGGTYAVTEDQRADRLSKIIRTVVTRLHAEVSRSINFYRSQQGGSAPTRVLLTGTSSLLPYMDQFFADKFQVPVEYFNPFDAVQVDPGAGLDLQSANVVVYPTDYTPYNSYTDAELAGLSLNSDLFDRFTVYFTEPVTKLSCDTPKTVQLNDEFPSASYTVTLNDGSVQCPHTGSVNNLISVTSSKPNLVSVQVTRIGSTSSASYLAKYTLKLTGHTGGLGGVGKSDTAKITVKAVDGSGKTFSFNVKVTSTMSG